MAEVVALVTAVISAVTAVLQLLANYRKRTSTAHMHKRLTDILESLRALQEVKEKEFQRVVTPNDATKVYLHWMDRVSQIAVGITSLDGKFKEVRAKRIIFFWIELCLRKKIKRALNEVIKLVGECSEKILVHTHQLPERVIKEDDVPSIMNYLTLKTAFDRVQARLRWVRVKCVALHGPKGVGKTTIMRYLNNEFYGKLDFDVVIFITLVSGEQTDRHILLEIARRLKVDKEVTDFNEVARKIQEVLENQRYLLILDGVRHPPDGIWKKLGISNGRRESKVVITTYYPLPVMSECVDQSVKLQPLPPEEALAMFRSIVVANRLPDKRIARLLCNRLCSRLPLLICPIAWSFNKDESAIQWKRVLDEFTPWPEVRVEGLDELYSNLEICYKPLGQSEQKCFLFAALYPANRKIYINYLVECCIVQGFLDKADTNKYSEMRWTAKQVLGHLVNVRFLEKEEQEDGEGEQEEWEEEGEDEDGEGEGEQEEWNEEGKEEGEQMRYVVMNDFYRQFALFKSSRNADLDCKTYVINKEDEERPSTLESWQNARWASMIGCERDSLPTNQNCGSLQILLLQKNLKLVQIPLGYFEPMGKLLVLNLHGTGISNLPSLGGLTMLKAFYLNGCSKLRICSQEIEALKCLEIFDIRDTSVNIVPCLKSLRCLRFSYYIASGDQSEGFGHYDSISELHNLQELTIEVKSPWQWCNNAQWLVNAKCIVKKVASLEYLTTFRCSFPSSESLKAFEETIKSWIGGKQILRFKSSWGVKTQNVQNSL